jgi:hypothetical protein
MSLADFPNAETVRRANDRLKMEQARLATEQSVQDAERRIASNLAASLRAMGGTRVALKGHVRGRLASR